MTILARYTGPGRLAVIDVEGNEKLLRKGDTVRVARLEQRQIDKGLREVGADLGKKAVARDVLERELGELRATLDEYVEREDEMRAELRALVGHRDSLGEMLATARNKIDRLEDELAERDEHVERLQSIAAAAEVVDKLWLDAENADLRRLLGALGEDVAGNSRRTDMLAWLYTQNQRTIAEAWAALGNGEAKADEGGDA